MGIRIALTFVLAWVCAAGATRPTSAEIRPLSVTETPYQLALDLEWIEEGSEGVFVVPGLNEWHIQVRVDELDTPDWRVEFGVFHRRNSAAGIPEGAAGGIAGDFSASGFGTVLSTEATMMHRFPPEPDAGVMLPSLPGRDRLRLVVERPEIDRPELRAIHLTATHIPEPASIWIMIGGALVLLGLRFFHAALKRRKQAVFLS
jgi:hypothetical protein